MEIKEKEKIIKLLQLTTSPNKHEAMKAMDMANKILKDNNLHWVDFISSQPSLTSRQTRERIDKCFSWYGPEEFFKSLYAILDKNLSLSASQEKTLDDMYKNVGYIRGFK